MILPVQEIVDRMSEDLVIESEDGGSIDAEQLQPCTVDLRLGDEFTSFNRLHEVPYIDPQEDVSIYGDAVTLDEEDEGYFLHPGEFVLAKTNEYVEIPSDLKMQVHGRSSLGRLAIVPHVQAGLVDPGYKGQITLEFLNLGTMPFLLRPGMRVCQAELQKLSSPTDKPYNGKYQASRSVVTSRIHEDEEN